MSRISDPDFEAWVQKARDARIADVAASLGMPTDERGRPCPLCRGGDDRFNLNKADNRAYCRQCQPKGMDPIAFVMEIMECEFIPAVARITGEDPPDPKQRPEPRPVDHDADRMREEQAKDSRIAEQAKDREARAKKANRSQEVFDSGVSIKGTMVDRCYLKERGISLLAEQAKFLRFIPSHPYYEQDERGPYVIGHFPAMVARMFSADMQVVGLHCTYLAPDGMKKAEIWAKDRDGNPLHNSKGQEYLLNPRKMYGTWGMILLSDIRPAMAFGEGIETTVSWYQLGVGPDEIGIAAAGSIGSLCGECEGSIPHPTLAGRIIGNGIPSSEKPGMDIPADVVERYFLGDRDDPPQAGLARLLAQARRQRAMGFQAFFHIPPELPNRKKVDWNDVLMAQMRRAA